MARIQTADHPTRSDSAPLVLLASAPAGVVELHLGALSGANILHLAVAVCVFNDLRQEASRRALRLERLAVSATGDFAIQPEPFHSTGITYAVDIAGGGSAADVQALVSHVERIAEIPHALRQGLSVQLGAVRISGTDA
jgi:putative redox protein